MPHLDLPGTTLYYETGGRIAGPAVLLLHADIATLRMWDGIVDDLERDHFVVRHDLRGFGETVSDDTGFSDRADALGLLDHLDVERAVMIGSSRGGTIALDLALETPARVTGLVTVAGTPSGHPPVAASDLELEAEAGLEAAEEEGDWALLGELEIRLWAIGLAREESEVDAEFAQLAYSLNRSNVTHVHDNPIAIPLNPPAYGRLDELRMPALIAVGEQDLVFQQLAFSYQVQTIPQATGARFARSAHLPSVEHPREFLRVLRAWFDRHGL